MVLLKIALLFFLSSTIRAEWQKYIVGPQQPIVFPQSIISTSGNVQNAEALIGGGGVTVLTRNTGDSPPSVILDFGINVVGFVSIVFNGASTNTPGIRLSFSETLQYLSDLSDYSRSNMANPITPGSDQIAVAALPYTWEDTWGCINGSQVCSDGLHGFRYMKIYLDALESDAPIINPTGTVNISSVSLKYSGFLGTPDTFIGRFECSDKELNSYWYNAVYTNDLTTDYFRETDVDPRGAFNEGLDGKLVLFDGAKRDRDPYVGDVAVSGGTGYLSHGNLTHLAARNVLADLAEHQRSDGYIPSASVMEYTLQLFDYPLWWVIAVNDYVLYSNDTEFLAQYFTNMEQTLNKFYPANTNQASNLLSRPAGYGDYAFVGRDGEASYYNVLYVYALKKAAECAEWIGQDELVYEWLNRTIPLSEAINRVFWDEQVGAYRNSVDKPASHPQDANAIAVLAGVANRTQAKSLLGYLHNTTALPYGNAFMDDDTVVDGGSQRVYAFMSTFDLRARMEVGEDATAIDEMKRLYGWMQTHDPSSTYWEGIGPGGSMYQAGFTSAAHGWSTGIVGVLTNYVLGIQFLSPGGDSGVFNPGVSDDITWARGQIPTPTGPLGAQWGDVNDTLTMQLDVPEGSTFKAKLPEAQRITKVVHNGLEIWTKASSQNTNVYFAEQMNALMVDSLQSGTHTIVASYIPR